MNNEQRAIVVKYFQCKDPKMDKFGKWGYKVQEKGHNIYKTRYDYEDRNGAIQAAKRWVNVHKPGEWKPEGARLAA
jgi:hypothetical protein